MLYLIWAQDEKGLIGKDQTLPWHVPTDLKFFKEKTMGQNILMGRVTFSGMKERLLPGRKTFVLTRNKDYYRENVGVFHSKEEVLQFAENNDLFIIGGRDVFKLFFKEADVLYQTILNHIFSGDRYFPDVSFAEFTLVEKTPFFDEKSQISGTFNHWIKKNK